MPRGKAGAEKGGKLAPAERRRDAQRIAEDRVVPGERTVDRLALAREAGIVEAGAVTGEASRRRRRTAPRDTADAAVVLPMPISPSTTRSASGDSAS